MSFDKHMQSCDYYHNKIKNAAITLKSFFMLLSSQSLAPPPAPVNTDLISTPTVLLFIVTYFKSINPNSK